MAQQNISQTYERRISAAEQRGGIGSYVQSSFAAVDYGAGTLLNGLSRTAISPWYSAAEGFDALLMSNQIPARVHVDTFANSSGQRRLGAVISGATQMAGAVLLTKSVKGAPRTGQVAAESEILTGGMRYTGRRLDVRAKFIDSPSAQVSTPGHAFASRRAAYQLALDPAVERVTMNAGYKRLLRLDDSVSLPTVRPDAAAVYYDSRIARIEIMSDGDRFAAPLIRRNMALDPQLQALGYNPLRPTAYRPTGR